MVNIFRKSLRKKKFLTLYFRGLQRWSGIADELITVCNDTYINALSFCELLRLITEKNVGVPITLILDNARYQKCKIVWELAELLDIELLYILHILQTLIL